MLKCRRHRSAEAAIRLALMCQIRHRYFADWKSSFAVNIVRDRGRPTLAIVKWNNKPMANPCRGTTLSVTGGCRKLGGDAAPWNELPPDR
jgi:hypothetical protein